MRYGNDQDGDPIPSDLVELPGVNTEEEYIAIMHANWYRGDNPRGPLLISFSVLDPLGLDGMDAIAEGLVHYGEPLMIIEPVLHRWSEEDGFYTA